MPNNTSQHTTHGLVSSFDESLARFVRHIPESFTPLMKFVSFLGLPAIVIMVGLSAAVVAWFKDSRRIAYAQVAATAALAGNTIIKYMVHRARPDTIYTQNMKIHSYSFPSGHAFGSAVFYGLLAYLAYSYIPQPWNLIVSIGLILLILLIGISRVYLGAHFPSDVVMGWLFGLVCLGLIIRFIQP